jgi:hypothetical protein
MGCDVPLVLREGEEGEFVLVGECFVLGMMHGELLEEGELEKGAKRIVLV